MDYFGGIEAGGTKIKCLVAADRKNILSEKEIPTSTPEQTLPEVVKFFRGVEQANQLTLRGLGLAFFGPLDLNPSSATYGHITTSPKLEWQGFDILSYFHKEFQFPLHLETDVNAAAIGEGKWGAAQGLANYIYITVGTGIGGGVVVNGVPITKLIHTETGHILLQRARDDGFSSVCPFHENCAEGLASGPALWSRWKTDPLSLPDEHPAWELESIYIAQLLHNLTLSCAPERIILGGGVMTHAGLIERIRAKFLESLNRYVSSPIVLDVNSFIVSPALGSLSGSLGAVALVKFR